MASPTYELLSELIPFGRENAIPRRDLAEKLSMSDREMRRMIEQARYEGLFVMNDQSGVGYYRTMDLAELKRQYDQDTSRALKILARRKPIRDTLKAAGVNLKN